MSKPLTGFPLPTHSAARALGRLRRAIFWLALLSLLLAACGPADTAAPATPASTQPAAKHRPTQPPVPTATSAPGVTEAPPLPSATAAPTASVPTATQPGLSLVLATTAPIADSGLLRYLLPEFEQKYAVNVWIVAVGSSQAIEMGTLGNADVLLVNSPTAERTFMDSQFGVRREAVMYDDYVIVGPAADPAGVGQRETAASALLAISEAKATFISRGDKSGTHNKETGFWSKLGVAPVGDWYISANQNMTSVLQMAQKMQAYTFTDRLTYLNQTRQGVKLKVLFEGGPDLFNRYNAIAVNPQKTAARKGELSLQLIDWLIALPTQEKIAAYQKAEYGMPMFFPNSAAWHQANP